MTSWTVYEFECDVCGETAEIQATTFPEAWTDLKDQGWVAFKEDGDWRHRCPSCR